MKKLMCCLMGFLGLSLTLVVPGSAQTKLTIAYVSNSPGNQALYWVAKEAGIYKKHGLDVDLVYVEGSSRAAQTLLSGDVNFATVAGSAAINAKLAGGDISILNSIMNALPYYVVANPEVKGPEDLKGRAAATHQPGTMADFALRLALRQVGATFADIKAVTIGTSGPRLAALASKQIDFAVLTDGEMLHATKQGMKVLMDLAALKVEFPAACQTALKKYINENPKIVQSLINAEAEAVHYFKTHKEETVKVMEKYTRGQDRKILEQVWEIYTKLLAEDTVPRGIQTTLDVTALSNPKAAGAKAEDFVDLRFVEEMKKSGLLDRLYGRR